MSTLIQPGNPPEVSHACPQTPHRGETLPVSTLYQSFNHNVRLKSHVQRYHGQAPTDKGKKTEGNVSEAELYVMNELDNNSAEAEQSEKDPEYNPEEEEMREKLNKRTKKGNQKISGRPRGRPKKNVETSQIIAGELSEIL